MAKHSGKNWFMGAVVGGTLGAMTALLFSTEKGKKIQKKLKYKMQELDMPRGLNMPALGGIKNKIERKLKSPTKRKAKRKLHAKAKKR